MIYPHHLEFMEEAKSAFESNPRFETYRNTEGNLIALRHGLDRNCIGIHEIGKEIGFFAEVMERAPELVVAVPVKLGTNKPERFDIRKAMLAEPNEWVGAYHDHHSKWIQVGFDAVNMCAKKAHYGYIGSVEGVITGSPTAYELETCIPIEDVPKEDFV